MNKITKENDFNDFAVLAKIKQGDIHSFNELYNFYWDKVLNYSYSLLRKKDIALDITQEIFVSLWVRRQEIEIKESLLAYLFASVRNQVVKHIRDTSQKEMYVENFEQFLVSYPANAENNLIVSDLKMAIENSLIELPPRCQEIFRMSRFKHLSISEIAQALNISHRTVENQLSIALKHLKDNLPSFIILLFISYMA